MLVNVSPYTGVQDQVAELVERYIKALQADIRHYSKLPESEALACTNLAALFETWKEEYRDAGPDWLTVQNALKDAVLPIVVKAVNQRTGAGTLDYATYRDDGFRVIAVGGNSLSRGLTLEGLSTSYFYRSSQMYDTLLQMGRWFGYRDSYADLCRLWLTVDAEHWYAHITEATEELRAEMVRMRQHKMSPREFGLKVRAHPDSIIVTARRLIVTAHNKMRAARTVERVVSVSGMGLETPRIWSDQESVRANATIVAEFLGEIQRHGVMASPSEFGTSTLLWRGVDRHVIASLLRRFRIHPRNFTFQGGELAAFLDETSAPSLQTWDVAVPFGDGAERTVMTGVNVRLQQRTVTKPDSHSVLVSGKRARVGSRGIEREGINPVIAKEAERAYREKHPDKKSVPDRVYRAVRPRPLLLLHAIEAEVDDGTIRAPLNTHGDILFGLGLSFPIFEDSGAKKVTYKVNVVEWQNMFNAEIDDDEPDEDIALA
jgi:hypothetical protein